MKIVKPSAVYMPQLDHITHIATCARICYNSARKGLLTPEQEDLNFVNGLIKNDHTSMLRHDSFYYFIPKTSNSYKSISSKLNFYIECPYLSAVYAPDGIYISTNGQFIFEHPMLNDSIKDYEISFDTIRLSPYAAPILRFTIVCNTQISTTREFNRVSPNNIAESSTRYIWYKHGITICEPYYYSKLNSFKKFICRLGWSISSTMYGIIRKWTKTNNAAREFLPLATNTKVVYTYTLYEWKRIMDLRYFGKTGAPHPNAFILASLIREQLVKNGCIIDELPENHPFTIYK